MSSKIDNVYGSIVISDEVIAKIAAAEATRCVGIVGMAYRSKVDQLASVLKKESSSKGVKVTNVTGGIKLQLHIIAEYGVNLSAISNNIIENVKYGVESMVGCSVKKIEIAVEGIRMEQA